MKTYLIEMPNDSYFLYHSDEEEYELLRELADKTTIILDYVRSEEWRWYYDFYKLGDRNTIEVYFKGSDYPFVINIIEPPELKRL